MDGWNTTFLLGRPIFRECMSFQLLVRNLEEHPSSCRGLCVHLAVSWNIFQWMEACQEKIALGQSEAEAMSLHTYRRRGSTRPSSMRLYMISWKFREAIAIGRICMILLSVLPAQKRDERESEKTKIKRETPYFGSVRRCVLYSKHPSSFNTENLLSIRFFHCRVRITEACWLWKATIFQTTSCATCHGFLDR